MADADELLTERITYLVPLNKLSTERQHKLLEQSEVVELRKKQTLFEQGDRDDYTFYVLEGDLEMYADDSLIKRVSGGDGASFQPLAQLQPRQMTAIAKTKARVLRVNRGLLDQLLSMDDAPAEAASTGVEVEEVETDASGDWLMTMLQSELFTRIPPSNIQSLLDTLETVELKAGDAVVTQGEPGDYFYALQTGHCEVVRTGSNKREIKLAELHPGDTFGEEALVSGARRNATVRMLADGELARLTKDDFAKLIKAPLLSNVSREDAEQLASDGAVWLDVRFEDEHAHNGLPGATNIPLGTLRTRMDELDTGTRYIAYCDSGGRSSAAAFLLAEKGFDVVYVEGGAVDEPLPEQPAEKAAPESPAPKKKAAAKKGKQKKAPADEAPAKKSPEPAAESTAPETLEADARATALAAEVEKASLTIEQAQKLMAEAEAMKAQAEKIVADKLAAEKQKMAADAEALNDRLAEAERREEEADKRIEDLESTAQRHLEEEKQKVEQEAEALRKKLEEAEKLKQTLAARQQAAEAEAEEQHREVEKKLSELEQKAAARLEEEKTRLEATFEKQAAQLESLQAEREAELREKLEAELTAERNKLSAEFARTTEELEKARADRQAALDAKEAAAAEAQRMIEEFKARQQELADEQRAALEQEREKLRAEAERIEKLRADAQRAREEAEAAQAQAEAELAKARERQDGTPAETSDDLEIIEIEQRAAAADRDLEKARETEDAVARAAKDNEDELERTYDTATEINMLLQRELNEWVDEQDKMQESTLQREILSRQKEMVERIKARAAQAAAQQSDHDKSLLDEIAEQLGDG